MALLHVNALSKAFGGQTLFSDIGFEVGERDKIGLVGQNGAGKTTLFKLLTDAVRPDGGGVVRSKELTLGYMEQHVQADAASSVYDEALSISRPICDMETRMTETADSITAGIDIERNIALQDSLHRQYEQQGGLTYKSRTRAALMGLGFSDADMRLPVSALSGGQRSKLSLCKLLLSNANLLLLDEPTNHLDIESSAWLEGFLQDFSGAIMVISHDRYFLDKVTNRTLELEFNRLFKFAGNYSAWQHKKESDRQVAVSHYKNTMREVKRIEGIIEQQRRWNREKNIKTAESKEKMLARILQNLEKPEELNEGFGFAFALRRTSGTEVLSCENLSKSFGDKGLYRSVDLQIRKGERVFLIGPNGCGKTTLFRQLLHPSPKITHGTNVDIGYYDQTLRNLSPGKTVMSEIHDAYPKMTGTEIRSRLAAFLFRGDSVFKPISALSGGEKARVSLLKLMLSGANTLLLDEPTNHLDIYAREALEDALNVYEGTLFMISHDRYFINKLADRIFVLQPDGVTAYEGNYEYYLERSAPATPANANSNSEKAAKPKADGYRQKKEAESLLRRNKGRLSRLEQEITVLEQDIETLTAELNKPEIASDYKKAVELSDMLEQRRQEHNRALADWATLAEEIG